MKNALAVIAAMLIACPKAMAFEPIGKNEISSQYAYFTGRQISTVFKSISTRIMSLGDLSTDHIYSTGLFKLQYHHATDEKVMYGVSAGYEWIGWELTDKEGNPKDRLVNQNCITLLGSGKIYYQSFSHFAMYWKFQAGIELISLNRIEENEVTDKKDIKVRPSFQAIPLGMEFGGKTLRGFVELGVGTQGIWSCGIKKQF